MQYLKAFVCKQMIDINRICVKLEYLKSFNFVLNMSSKNSFKNKITNKLFPYKAIDNPHGLICHKAPTNERTNQPTKQTNKQIWKRG